MAYTVKPMLYLSELYFTDGENSYRFQWTNQAFVDKVTYPGRAYDDSEYYQELAKYNYMSEHLNDGSENAVSYRINIYSMGSGECIYTNSVAANSIDVELDKGEYLWEVEALDSNGKTITVSEKSYINTRFSDWDDEMTVSYRDSNAEFLIGYVGEQSNYDGYGDATFPDWYCRVACAGRISGSGGDSDFLVCGPAQCGNEAAWRFAQDYDFTYSTANAFGGFDGEFLLAGNTLITCSGIYEYEDGQWNYKIFTAPWVIGPEYRGNQNYFFLDGEKTIYKWDTDLDKIIEVAKSAKEIYYISDYYYVTADGVFSIVDNALVVEYNVYAGECPVYNDMFFNIYAKNSAGQKLDYVPYGSRATVAVSYFFFDKTNEQVIEKEVTLFEGTAPFAVDAEEILETRIGNCICFAMQDENDEMVSNEAYVYIHEINEDGTVTQYDFKCNTWGDITFGVNESGKLTVSYPGADWQDETRIFDIQPVFDELFPDTKPAAGDKYGISLQMVVPGESHITEYALDSNFDAVLQLKTNGDTSIDTYGLPAGKYSLRISAAAPAEPYGLPSQRSVVEIPGDNESDWIRCQSIISDNSSEAQLFESDKDGDLDVFFAGQNGTWSADFFAWHVGSRGSWGGTKEQVNLAGKNKIAGIFNGSETDASVLVLTDDAHGDALFVDDFYTDLPESVAERQARFTYIDEIRAGAGDDIIDMTSQRFSEETSVTIYGGLGDDTIWANDGENKLFGDAGNDRIIGGTGNDVIVGGVGDDRMHGGGGSDIFCFGKNWGKDIVEQISGEEVILWFESGTENKWNSETLTYTDGKNSVTVTGVSNDLISLRFGEGENSSFYAELAADGCFADAASEKIFENKGKGMLA